MPAAQLRTVDLGEVQLQTATWGQGAVDIVMLHDGLGSLSQWRDTPASTAEATGVAVMAYERAGHGSSLPQPSDAWPTDWLHREAAVLGDLLEAAGIDRPLIVGHSDGGSIALLHAAAGGTCQGIIALAAHSWVEPVCTEAISAMARNADRFVSALDAHHDAPGALFDAWSGVWLSNDFASWDIRPMLGAVDVPALVIQGDADRYATSAQLVETTSAIGANASSRELSGIGHIIHHEQPEVVTELVADFYDQIQLESSQRS